MKAMVLAAGLGTRLRPLTYEITKPMVPVLDRPVMAHILDLVDRYEFERRDREPALLPGVDPRVLRRADLVSLRGGAARYGRRRARLRRLLRRRAVPRDLRRRADGHRPGRVRRPPPRERAGSPRSRSSRCTTRASTASCCTIARGGSRASRRSPRRRRRCRDLGNCGIYIFEPRIFDYFPDRPFVDWAKDVFPALLENDVPFHIHEVREYWNDVGSLAELRQGTFDALRGELRLQMGGEEVAPGVTSRRAVARGHRARAATSGSGATSRSARAFG